ncbi:MAG TPA: NAD-dependent epimerase/dehydratase family protein [Bryobacteraceae bacterium]
MPRARILITGGAGFLGSHLTANLLAHGTAVRIFDLADRPDWVPVSGPDASGVEYVPGDIRDGAALGSALEGVDAVIHAAFASPRMAPETIEEVNVGGARELSRQTLSRGVSRVVLISSSVVERAPHVHPFLRRAGINAFDLYRKSRAEAERVFAEQASRGFRLAMARPKTFVGPGRVSAFNIIFEWIRQGRPVLLMGEALNHYQLLEIGDMAEGIRLLTNSDAEGVFHFGATRFGTFRGDLQALIDHAGTGSRLRFVPGLAARAILRGMELAGMPPPSELHYMSARGKDSVANTTRATGELGWQPKWGNVDALRSAYDWYVQSMATTGTAKSIHMLPKSHRALGRVIDTLLR